MNLPVDLDPATQKSVVDLLNKINTRQKGEILTIGYEGDLKPLIDKAIALGIEQAFQEEAREPGFVPAAEIENLPPKSVFEKAKK